MTATTRAKQARRRLILALAAAVVAAGGVAGGLIATGSSPAGGATAQRTRTVAAAIGTLKQTVSTTGTIAPAQVDDLSFPVSGQVTAVDVSVGQTVRAGQTLATIGTASLSDTVAAAQANLTAAESTLSSAEAAGGSTAQITADQAAVTSAQSQLSAAQQSLAGATLTSPIAGTVAAVNLSVGEQVSGSAGSTKATSGGGTASGGTQIEVIGTGSWVVTGTITDTEVSQVRDGDQATIALAGSSSPVYGLVAQVGLIATDTDGVASFPFTIDVTGSPAGLYDGITADVSITTRELANVLTVPTAALHEVDGHSVVYEMSGGKQVAHTVTTGQSEGGLSQITSGLSPGTDVVVPVVGRGPGAAGRTTNGRAGGFGGAGGLGGAGARGLGGAGARGLGGAGARGLGGAASALGGG